MHEDGPATGRTVAYGFKSDFQFNSFAMHDSNIGKRIAQFGNGDLLLKKDSSDSSFNRGGNAENRELLLRCAGYWNLLGKSGPKDGGIYGINTATNGEIISRIRIIREKPFVKRCSSPVMEGFL